MINDLRFIIRAMLTHGYDQADAEAEEKLVGDLSKFEPIGIVNKISAYVPFSVCLLNEGGPCPIHGEKPCVEPPQRTLKARFVDWVWGRRTAVAKRVAGHTWPNEEE